jgi:hypothetical protein
LVIFLAVLCHVELIPPVQEPPCGATYLAMEIVTVGQEQLLAALRSSN